ncbi:MAG: alpha-L-rhamnosidase C-terminal domain-containing protein [Ferruginibacter sp.]
MNKLTVTIGIILLLNASARCQLPPVFDAGRAAQAVSTPTTRKYLSPVKIVWQSATDSSIVNSKRLLLPGNGQADLANSNMCVLKSGNTTHPSMVLDYGKELHGGLQIITGMYPGNKPVKLRVRFGESVSETMSEIEPKQNATNDHAMRDEIVQVPWLGKLEIGNTGFRFVRIDLLDDNTELQIKEVRAIFIYRDIPYLGSFHCSDTLLNNIWLTGAYTVHLNMQDYLWDGIKRDRLVWIGDMHPETSTISAVFGNNEVVTKSLDLSRDITPLPQYMNGMISYSMWWVIIHRDWYMHTGDLKYLREQKTYLAGLLTQLSTKIDANNSEALDGGGRFLDWPSSEYPKAVHAGLQAMLILTLEAGAELSVILNDNATAQTCRDAVARLRKYIPDVNNSKQAAALLALAGLMPAAKANTDVLAVNGAHNFSTFYGYYMLQAKAMAGDYQGAIDNIKEYWGAMLKLGATTFWEDFNLDWLPNASQIDAVVKPGQKDIHGDYGAYCYIGFRHSLCHGWASGPTPWLTEHVLGIKVLKPGCKVIKIEPHLGDLSFAEGTFPTPYGLVKIKHVKQANGKITSTISGPKEVTIVR